MPRVKYTPEEVDYLHKYYSRTDNAVLAARMSKPTTPEQIRNFANRHGLTKSQHYTEALHVRKGHKMNETMKKNGTHSRPPSDLMAAISAIGPDDGDTLIKWEEGWTEGNARTCVSRVNSVNKTRKDRPFRLHGHYRTVDGYILIEVEKLHSSKK